MAKKNEQKLTFEESVDRIDEIISMLESKEISLEDSVSYYQEAMNLIKNCHVTLTKIEGKVAKVVKEKNRELEEINVD